MHMHTYMHLCKQHNLETNPHSVPANNKQYNQHFPSLDNTQIESHIIKSICLIYFQTSRFHHKHHAKNNSLHQTSSAHKAFLYYFHSILEMIQSHTTHGENKHLLIYLNILNILFFRICTRLLI